MACSCCRMLTQHAPVAQDSQPLQDSPTQVDADDSMLVESDADSEHEEEDSGQSNSQTPQKFRHLKDVATVSFTQATQQHSDPTAETANRPSFAIADDGEEVDDVEQSQTQEAIPNSPKAFNAFDIMQQAQQIGPTASSSELAGEHKKEKKKKERNAFVQDQADESDEEAGFMRGFAKKKDDEEDDDNSDDEGSVKEIFDDAKVDDDLQREQDDRVIEKDQ